MDAFRPLSIYLFSYALYISYYFLSFVIVTIIIINIIFIIILIFLTITIDFGAHVTSSSFLFSFS